MELHEILEYYSGLLIVQYRGKEKAINTTRVFANQSVCDGIMEAEKICFDLDTALGAQLTVLGKIIGVERNVYGLDLGHVFFNFTRYLGSPASYGFGRYNVQPDAYLFYRYNNYAIYTLTDFEMRALIYLKIIFNNKYSSFKRIKEALWAKFRDQIDIAESPLGVDTDGYTFFNFTRYSGTPASTGFGRYGDDPYIDYIYRYAYSGLMQLTYQVKTIYQNAVEAAVFLNIIPKPMAVRVNVVYN
jgi:hypothetical protein